MSNPEKEADSKKPVSRITLRGITASVFENRDSNNRPFYKTSLTRTYRDGDEFRTSTTFSRDDLPRVQEAAHQAWLQIMDIESGAKQTES